jgi:hypothetical protein
MMVYWEQSKHKKGVIICSATKNRITEAEKGQLPSTISLKKKAYNDIHSFAHWPPLCDPPLTHFVIAQAYRKQAMVNTLFFFFLSPKHRSSRPFSRIILALQLPGGTQET